jgi:16S rRNA (guanine527-N7)-methyltransferase
MDETAAKAWLTERLNVSRETLDQLDTLVTMLREENSRQNLMSAKSLEDIWSRHIIDSAQLFERAHGQAGPWMDLGSGAGLPGLVLASLDPDQHVVLVESRKLRWEWLQRAAETLSLRRVTVEPMAVEQVKHYKAGLITARAFAPLPKLFGLAHRFSTRETLWLLPKGRSAAEELASTRGAWQCDATMEPSVTDPDSAIIVARNVHPVTKGRRR